jgi:hypothetical protein
MPKKNKSHARGGAGQHLLAGGQGIAPAYLMNPPLSYPREAFATIWVPGLPIVVPAASGIVASSTVLDPTSRVNNFLSRFGVFEEYRVVKVEMKVRSTQGVVASGLANGTHVSYWDEFSSAAPTSSNAVQRNTKERTNNANDRLSQYNMYWKPQDPKDLEFTATTTAVAPVYFKVYSDITNFANGNVTSTNEFILQPWFLIQFRGLRG